MLYDFYNSIEYKKKQSILTKENWRIGKLDSLYKREKRKCARPDCNVTFETIRSDPKKYCSRRCSGMINNVGRKLSDETKQKIGEALKGSISPFRGVMKMPRLEIVCGNPNCKKVFFFEQYKKRKFCSNQCAMDVIGGRPTSPKAAKGKAGIRIDISDKIYFYSRWEANIARLYNYMGIKWLYAPKSFDIGGQFYTPDFYLPKLDKYIEVKNFWWKY